MKVITITDPKGTTVLAVEQEPAQLQVLRSPKPGGKP